jgi:hydroxymethylglutaryl-CoA lyase
MKSDIVMQDFVEIVEVGPRDGLQNETRKISIKNKVKLIDQLSQCGFKRIETTSFVSPKWVPQMACSEDVLKGINRNKDISYLALTPNMKGLEMAISSGADEVAIFGSASEAFSKANINCTIEESIKRFRPLVKFAQKHSLPVRGYVSCITECPFEGFIKPEKVLEVTSQLFELGCYEVSLGETLGKSSSQQISTLLEKILKDIPVKKVAGHFHDTKKFALENIKVALDFGVRTFDSSVGGLGGCPYAPGASGNVATESLLDMLIDLNYVTGLEREQVNKTALFAKTLVKN